MPLNFDFSQESEMPFSHKLATDANDKAVRATDARKSREALEKDAREEINHPTHQRIIEASRSRRIIIYGLLAVVFCFVAFWEWSISKEIYEIWFPQLAFAAFTACMGVAFYVSACLGESIPEFSFRRDSESKGDAGDADAILSELYDRKIVQPRSKVNWLLDPVLGAGIGLLFMVGIFLASQERVRLLREAKQVSEGTFQAYLPVVLYGVEILLGIPAFFCIVWIYGWLRLKKLRVELTEAKNAEITVRQSAVADYMLYMKEFESRNEWLEKRGRTVGLRVPPNEALRQLFVEEFGRDPFNTDNSSTEKDDSPKSQSDPGTSPGMERSQSKVSGEVPPDYAGRNNQVDDLIKIIDDQNEQFNRTL